MYLLKPIGPETITTLNRNLHSTMYLLKLGPKTSTTQSTIFTFHYVSIKTRGLK